MKPCRCLLNELDEKELLRGIREYIAGLPEEQKASPAAYSRRLEGCRSCESLVNGMCALCGCFVEVRAAKRRLSCPGSPARWAAEAERPEESGGAGSFPL